MKSCLLSVATACVFVVALVVPTHASAQDAAAHANETDTQRFVRMTRQIESQPLGADELADAWLVTWVDKTPDYMALVCPMAGPEWNLDDKFALQLLLRAMVGNVAFQIERGKDTDELAKQVAGAETALRIYAATVAKHPSKRSPFFDGLIAKRDAGTLRDFMQPFVAKDCKVDEAQPAAVAEESPFLGGYLRESWVLYPLDIDGWQMFEEHRYEEAELGVSVRFARKGDDSGWIDAYFYPVGKLEAAELADAERKGLLQKWGTSMRDESDMSPLSPFDAGKLQAYILDFAYEPEGELRNSAMVVAVRDLYAVKLRYSSKGGKVSRAQVRSTLQAFAQALIPSLDIHSTGECCEAPSDLLPTAPEGKRLIRFEYSRPVESTAG